MVTLMFVFSDLNCCLCFICCVVVRLLEFLRFVVDFAGHVVCLLILICFVFVLAICFCLIIAVVCCLLGNFVVVRLFAKCGLLICWCLLCLFVWFDYLWFSG